MFGGKKEKVKVPAPLLEARERYEALRQGGAEKLKLWRGLYEAESQCREYVQKICNGVCDFISS